MAVQKLFDACKAVFPMSNFAPPSAESLHRVRTVLDGIKASDVGLEENSVEQERGFGMFGRNGVRGRHSMSARWAPPISYLHLYECESFSMGIFCLPTSAVIPLHNHPGMTVLSKLLYGSMHVKAYDWVSHDERLNGDSSRPRIAKLVIDKILTAPCETAILHPTSGGNIHAFTAVTPCAVLDVLAPPYSALTGRHCTYYREYLTGLLPPEIEARILKDEGTDENDQGYCWLEEFQPPDDFVVHRGVYRGPRIVP
ncbi:unnamed protein product [Calypogeia fissa]